MTHNTHTHDIVIGGAFRVALSPPLCRGSHFLHRAHVHGMAIRAVTLAQPRRARQERMDLRDLPLQELHLPTRWWAAGAPNTCRTCTNQKTGNEQVIFGRDIGATQPKPAMAFAPMQDPTQPVAPTSVFPLLAPAQQPPFSSSSLVGSVTPTPWQASAQWPWSTTIQFDSAIPSPTLKMPQLG